MRCRTSAVGIKLNSMLVVEEIEKVFPSGRKVLCLCECGNHKVVDLHNLKKGMTKSCGCLQVAKLIARGRANGMSSSKLYRAWKSVLNRCNSPKSKDWKNYGGRGIKVADEWHYFDNFYRDNIEGYVHGLTLDRWPNKDGNYEPGNVRWATFLEQANNKRNNRIIHYGGESKTLAEWARVLGMNPNILGKRIDRNPDVNTVFLNIQKDGKYKTNG
jgi:hypothetical protein